MRTFTVLSLLLCSAVSGQTFELDPAHKAASVLVLERMKSEDPAGYARLRRCPPGSVLLIDGTHDHTDRVLRGLRLPWRRVSSRAFGRTSLSRVRLIILDCPGDLDTGGIARLRRWVHAGGTLLSTDWAVTTVDRAFPRHIRATGRRTRDDVVRISWPTGYSHRDPLLRGVFPPGRVASWWLENQSYPVRCIDARTIIQSRDMGRKYGESGLCFRFAAGRGTVVHIVSHTYLQRTVCTHPWELRSALAEAGGLRLPRGSAGYERLAKDGTLKRLRAGELNAAVGIQQFVLNVFMHSLRPRPVIRPPIVRPTPRPPVFRGDRTALAKETTLRASPGGEILVRLNAGLRVAVVKREDGWAYVVTPAGQRGWIRL